MSFLTFLFCGSQSRSFDLLQKEHLLNNIGISCQKNDPRTGEEIKTSGEEYYSNGSICTKYSSDREIKLITLHFISYNTAYKIWEQFRTYSIHTRNVFGLVSPVLCGWAVLKVFSNRSLQRTNLLILVGALVSAILARIAHTRAQEIPTLQQSSNLAPAIAEDIISFRKGVLYTSPPCFNYDTKYLQAQQANVSQFFTENEERYFMYKILTGDLEKMIKWCNPFYGREIIPAISQAELVNALKLFRYRAVEIKQSYKDFVIEQIEPFIIHFLNMSKFTNPLDVQLASLFNNYYIDKVKNSNYINKNYDSAFLRTYNKIIFKLKTGIRYAIKYIKSEAINKDFTLFLYLSDFKSQMIDNIKKILEDGLIKKIQDHENSSFEWFLKQFNTIQNETIKAVLLDCLKKSLKNS